ncbi:hypothetical protein THAOC_29060, partial [Thalassiosira oceanica]
RRLSRGPHAAFGPRGQGVEKLKDFSELLINPIDLEE